MGDLLKAGTTWLGSTLMRTASHEVFYLLEGEQPQPIAASIGQSLFRVDDDGISKIIRTDRDFIFRVSDLRRIGIIKPKPGDKINAISTIAGDTISRTYLVLAPDGEQASRQSDGRDELIRVHTKLDCEEVLS